MQITGRDIGKVIGLGVMSGGAYLVGRIHGWIDAVKLTAKLTELTVEAKEVLDKADAMQPDTEEVEEVEVPE